MLYKITERENPLDRSQKKFYAAPSYTGDVDLRKVADDISRLCTLTPADINAVLESFLDILPGYLEEGHSVKLGNLGRFRLSFSSVGKSESTKVSSDDITNTRIIFVPSGPLKDRLDHINYQKR